MVVFRTYKHIPKVTELNVSANYHFFKEGIQPMWEDPSNAAGGKWTILLARQPQTDNAWLLSVRKLMFFCLGFFCLFRCLLVLVESVPQAMIFVELCFQYVNVRIGFPFGRKTPRVKLLVTTLVRFFVPTCHLYLPSLCPCPLLLKVPALMCFLETSR
jgi:Eukaryotic initiation factor 4E